MRRALVVIGKAPLAGRTKTRLVPPLSSAEAAALYRGFLADTLELGLELEWDQVTVVHPRGDGEMLTTLVPNTVKLLTQSGHGIGGALTTAFEHHLARGFGSVVLIGSDNPTLPVSFIRDACAALMADADLAIGPSVDGGYYLIGMREPYLGLFEDVDWSTSRVYTQTIGKAGALGLRVHSVAEWYDVDEPADLERLQRELRVAPANVAPHTRAVLEQLTVRA